MSDDDPLDVVQSVGELDGVVVLLREFLHRSGAIRAVAALDREGAAPAIVDCARLAPVEVTTQERRVVLPHALELGPPLAPCPDVRQLPPFEVDAATGEIGSPLGGMEHYARAVRALAALVGERAVVLVTWATQDAETPLSITARGEDPLVVSLADEPFEMDADWPPPGA